MYSEHKKGTYLSLEALYKEILKDSPEAIKAKSILQLRDWLNSVCDFDKRDGTALPTSINKINSNEYFTNNKNNKIFKDRVWKITNHSSDSVLHILSTLRTRVIREHKIMPIHSVRQVDSKTIQWLSKKTGRSIKEKLAGKPYIKAMNRKMSNNTTENRLLKDYLTKLKYYIEANLDTFADNAEDIYYKFYMTIKEWLNSDEAHEISPWSNLPPNNTLLQDKNYRKVWDSWLWLQKLDDDIKSDQLRFSNDWESVLLWTIISKLNYFKEFRLTEQPIRIDNDKFSINHSINIYGVLYSTKNNKPTTGFNIKYTDNEIILSIASEKIYLKIKNSDHDNISVEMNNMKENYNCSIKSINIISEYFIDKFINIIFKNGYDLNLLDELDDEEPDNQNADIVIDIAALQPSYAINGTDKKLPFKQLYQIWEDCNQIINIGSSRAIGLLDKTTTISILEILSPANNASKSDLRNIMMNFSENLSLFYHNCKSFTYLVPDIIDDFRLTLMRKSINFYFNHSDPLPKSIATLFSWIADKTRGKTDIQADDCVLVVDKISDSLTFTPLVAKQSSNKKLLKLIPETKGICWERHPTFEINMKKYFKNKSLLYNNDGCTENEILIKTFGTDCIEQFSDDITFIFDENKNYTISSEIINKRIIEEKIKWTDIDRHIHKISKNNIHLIINDSINTDIKLEKSPENVTINKIKDRKCFGGSTLNKWQKLVNTPLWTDHLPILSIEIARDNKPYTFYLVKDTAIIPKRGSEINIPIKESFILPKNRKYYNFPLTQGENENKLDYKVYLRSTDFLLAEDTAYKVRLIYKYGEDDPYELNFIPHDDTLSLNPIKAEWRDADDFMLDDLIYPDFPEREDWEHFRDFEGRFDLFEKLTDKLNAFCYILGAGEDFSREVGLIKSTRDLERGFLFTEDDIYCNKSQFINLKPDDFSNLESGTKLSYNLEEGSDGREFAKCIVVEEDENGDNISEIEITYMIKKNGVQKEVLKPSVIKLRNEIRFYMFTLWKNGSITNYLKEDRDNSFIEEISKMLINLEDYMLLEECNEIIKKEILFLLSITHKDISPKVSENLINLLKDNKSLIQYRKYIGYALGDLSTDWQIEIFNELLKQAGRKKIIEIFSISFWRSENLVHLLNKKQLELLLDNLLDSLAERKQKGINSEKEAEWLVIEIELLLALLRSRESEKPEMREVLYPNKRIVKDLLKTISSLTLSIIKSRIELNSRLKITLDKPEIYRNTPDLLYAVKAYLECDTGANSIKITGVSDD